MRTIGGMGAWLNTSHRWESNKNENGGNKYCLSSFVTWNKMRDPVDRFISRFNYNRWKIWASYWALYMTIATKWNKWNVHTFYCWHFCFQRPGWWKQVDAESQDICTATKGGAIFFDRINFLFFSGREKEQIWLAVFSTGSLSVFIRWANFLIKHQFVQTVKAQVLILGFQGTVPQNQRLYRADSQVKVLLLFLSSAFSCSFLCF